MRGGIKPSEHQIQSSYFDGVRLKEQYDKRYLDIHSVPNGGDRHIAVAVKMQREGARAGVLDVCVDVPVHHYSGRWIPGLRIEHKRPGEKCTPEQSAKIERLLEYGFCVAVSHSAEASDKLTEQYFAGRLDPGVLHVV